MVGFWLTRSVIHNACMFYITGDYHFYTKCSTNHVFFCILWVSVEIFWLKLIMFDRPRTVMPWWRMSPRHQQVWYWYCLGHNSHRILIIAGHTAGCWIWPLWPLHHCACPAPNTWMSRRIDTHYTVWQSTWQPLIIVGDNHQQLSKDVILAVWSPSDAINSKSLWQTSVHILQW